MDFSREVSDMPEETARLFVGIEPDEAARRALSGWAQALSVRVPGRFYAPEMYHVTLCFLGQTARGRIPAITRAMREAFSGAFEARLSEAGTFKGGAVLYAGVEKSARLAALQDRLCASLRREGFVLNEEAENYVPHITLARHAAGLTEPEKAPECAFPVRFITLFESARVDGRLCYTPIARVPGEEEHEP